MGRPWQSGPQPTAAGGHRSDREYRMDWPVIHRQPYLLFIFALECLKKRGRQKKKKKFKQKKILLRKLHQ